MQGLIHSVIPKDSSLPWNTVFFLFPFWLYKQSEPNPAPVYMRPAIGGLTLLVGFLGWFTLVTRDGFSATEKNMWRWRWSETVGYEYIWWRYQMETFSALLDLCEGNSPVNGEFPSQRPVTRTVTRSFDVFFHVCLNKRLNKQSWGWWFETPSRSLWRHCNEPPFWLWTIFVTVARHMYNAVL